MKELALGLILTMVVAPLLWFILSSLIDSYSQVDSSESLSIKIWWMFFGSPLWSLVDLIGQPALPLLRSIHNSRWFTSLCPSDGNHIQSTIHNDIGVIILDLDPKCDISDYY